MSESAPVPPAQPSVPSRRFARTALLVHGVSLLTGGALFLVAYFEKEPSAREVFGSVALAVICVGLLWAVALSLRARTESSVVRFLIPWLTAWEFSIPLLMLWENPLRDYGPAWYYVSYSGLPLFFPLLTISATVALPLFLILQRFSRRNATTTASAWKRNTIIASAVGVFIFLGLLPFAFLLYGATMASKWTSTQRPFWSTSTLEIVPEFLRDGTYRFVRDLPGKLPARMEDDLARHGLLSVEEYRFQLDETNPNKNYKPLGSGYISRYPEDALRLAKERLDLPTDRSILTSVIVYEFAQKSSTAEMKELLAKRRTRQGGFTTQGDDVLRFLAGRKDIAELTGDIVALEDSHWDILLWRVRELARHGSDEQLRAVYLQLLQSTAPQVMVNTASDTLARRRKWAPIFAAFEHSVKEVRKKSRIGLSYYTMGRIYLDEFKPHLLEHRITYLRMLDSPDRDDAAAIAILIQSMTSTSRSKLITAYCNLVPRPDLNWIKIQSASAQEKTDLIEKARAILNGTNKR